jgi:hypothetical protein
MTQLQWEIKTIVCDICKERPYKTVIEVSRGIWKGVCEECNPDKGVKEEPNRPQK